MSTPFKRVDDIYKAGSKFNDEGFVPFIINKELSKNPVLLPLVNELQQYTLPPEILFRVLNAFAPHTRRPGFREFPWIWKGKETVSADTKIVANLYNESRTNAQDYIEVLEQTDDGKRHLEWLRTVYGTKNQKKKAKRNKKR
jgi:hypothetical protein